MICFKNTVIAIAKKQHVVGDDCFPTFSWKTRALNGSRKITKSAETCFLFCDHRWMACHQKYLEIIPSANKHGNGKSVLYRTHCYRMLNWHVWSPRDNDNSYEFRIPPCPSFLSPRLVNSFRQASAISKVCESKYPRGVKPYKPPKWTGPKKSTNLQCQWYPVN